MVLSRASSSGSIRHAGVLPKTGLAVFVGLSTGLLLSPPTFRTAAVIGVEDMAGRLHGNALRTASELALSRAVLLRAANHLVETNTLLPPPSLL